MVCPRHRLFLCSYCQLVLKGMVRFCSSFDRKAFSRHEGMECCLFGSHSLAGFSPAESRGVALVKFLRSGEYTCSTFSDPVLGGVKGTLFHLVSSLWVDSHNRVYGGVEVFN